MKWLITGGCGFIGRNLIRNLIDEGDHHVRIVDNLSVGTREDLSRVCTFSETDPQEAAFTDPDPETVQLVVGDILDVALAEKATAGMDVIVHLAANTGVAPSVADPRSDCMANVIGTLNYLEAARCRRVSRFVFASSGAPVGECKPPIHEELAPHPVSPYGASKLAGEGYCSAYYRSFGVETVALRFGNVYGPLSGRKDSVVARFIRRALEGHTLEIYGDGSQTRDFIFVEDLIEALKKAAVLNDIGGEIFQIASNLETTVSELTEMIVEAVSKSGAGNVCVVHANPRTGDVIRNFSDTAKARKLLGWEAFTPLPEGLMKTIEWFKKA